MLLMRTLTIPARAKVHERHALLITGFLGFGDVVENPSAMLAPRLGARHALLEVAYEAVDAFLHQLCNQPPPRMLVMLGVGRKASQVKIERFARNHLNGLKDVREQVRGPGPIDPSAPAVIPGNLFDGVATPPEIALSDDAGGYLCNYAYFMALRRLPQTRVGFVHVPPLEAVPLDIQHRTLTGLLGAV
jgi:pyroglutamyl-peptidase